MSEVTNYLLNDLEIHGNRIVIFSDVKTFTVDPVVNKQNDYIINFGQDISELQNASTTKHPASMMMPPVWFPRGCRLTAAVYKDVLVTKILPCVRKITRSVNYIFQQDDAPAHTANIVQDWLRSNLNFWPRDFWPPQSSDLNPLDYSVRTHIESKACKVRHSSVEELKSFINRSWASMREDFIRKVCKGFRPRLSCVIAAEGGHIDFEIKNIKL